MTALLFFSLLPLWGVVDALRFGSYNTVFFGRFDKTKSPVDFWFFVSAASILFTLLFGLGLKGALK